MLVYLDTNIVIYLVQQPPDLGQAQSPESPRCAKRDLLAVSPLVRMECRIQPLALGDTATLAQYEAFFQSADVVMLKIPEPVFEMAAEIRARNARLRALDALHLATAMEAGCQLFLTNDARLSGFSGISVEALP